MFLSVINVQYLQSHVLEQLHAESYLVCELILLSINFLCLNHCLSFVADSIFDVCQVDRHALLLIKTPWDQDGRESNESAGNPVSPSSLHYHLNTSFKTSWWNRRACSLKLLSCLPSTIDTVAAVVQQQQH